MTAGQIIFLVNLAVRQTTETEIKIEEILEVIPYSGPFAADIDAVAAGCITECFKTAIDGAKRLFYLVGKFLGLHQLRPSPSADILERTDCLRPVLSFLPGWYSEVIWFDHRVSSGQ